MYWRLMLSAANCNHILKVLCTKNNQIKIIDYCNHSVNLVIFDLTQSDNIKNLLL